MNKKEKNQKRCSHNFIEVSDNRIEDPATLEFRFKCEYCGVTMIEQYRLLERRILNNVRG